jgi:hypothetical protein
MPANISISTCATAHGVFTQQHEQQWQKKQHCGELALGLFDVGPR